jgi:hypothetical protein
VTLKNASPPSLKSDPETIGMVRWDSIRHCTRDLLMVERAKVVAGGQCRLAVFNLRQCAVITKETSSSGDIC